MYVTLKFDDNGCCRIHSISDDGNWWIVTNERYVVMPWKMVTWCGKNMGPHTPRQSEASGPGPCGAMTFTEAVDSIFSQKESEAKESERREKERIEKKCKEYYEVDMKEETERLNKFLINWYELKFKEIREAPIESRPRKLRKLYRHIEVNKDIRLMIDSVGIINPVNYPKYPPELELPEYKDNNKESILYIEPRPGSSGCKPSNQLDYFRKIIRAYQGRDEDVVEYIKKVKELMDKPLDEIELKHIRLAMAKAKCPCKLDI